MSEEDMSADHRNAPPGEEEADSRTNVQTLTDLFDQLDRAAFKRVLDQRDSLADPPSKTVKRS